MKELCRIRHEICSAHSSICFKNYYDSVRKWLNGQITFEKFDEIAQKYISIELHTKFLLKLVSLFNVCFIKLIFFTIKIF